MVSSGASAGADVGAGAATVVCGAAAEVVSGAACSEEVEFCVMAYTPQRPRMTATAMSTIARPRNGKPEAPVAPEEAVLS